MIGGYKMGICKRCGKGLKNKESLEKGYGPVCFKKEFPKIIIPTITLEDFEMI